MIINGIADPWDKNGYEKYVYVFGITVILGFSKIYLKISSILLKLRK